MAASKSTAGRPEGTGVQPLDHLGDLAFGAIVVGELDEGRAERSRSQSL